ncbi:MAG: hypothetical protein ACPG8O_04070 [Alcanivorax nanhaiticus]
MNKPIRTLFTALFPLALVACDTSEAPKPEAHAEAPIETGIIVTDWQQQSLEQFEQAAAHWQQALVNLEQNKDEKNLAALRQSLADWYHLFTEQAPLLNARACQLNQQAILARMDTWPLYPGYVDSMPEWPESGLISDPYLELNRKNLRIQHGATDSAEASLGFAAMLVVLNGTGETAKPLAFFQDEAQQAPRRLRSWPTTAHSLQRSLWLAVIWTVHSAPCLSAASNSSAVPTTTASWSSPIPSARLSATFS